MLAEFKRDSAHKDLERLLADIQQRKNMQEELNGETDMTETEDDRQLIKAGLSKEEVKPDLCLKCNIF